MSRRVNGTGPAPARVCLIGQRPGAQEVRMGRPFVGPAGQELDRYLFVNAGLNRPDVFVTNLVRDFDGEDEITAEEIQRDWPELMQELERVRPRYIGLVGLYAARAFLGDDVDVEVFHGLCIPSNWCVRCRGVCRSGVITYSGGREGVLGVAEGVQRPSKLWGTSGASASASPLGERPESASTQVPLRSTNTTNSRGGRAASHLREQLMCESVSHGSSDERGTRESALESGLSERTPPNGKRAEDRQITQVGLHGVHEGEHTSLPCTVMPLYHPAAGLHMPAIASRIAHDFIQFGRMVRGEELPIGHLSDALKPRYHEASSLAVGLAAADTEGSTAHPWCVSVSTNPGAAYVIRSGRLIAEDLLILHHAIHDLPVLEAMGVHPQRWTDTMLMAALLGTEPQGLKALARRHAGMLMQDYSDVVREARREKALEYLSHVVDWCPPDPVKEKKPKRRKKTLTEELEMA